MDRHTGSHQRALRRDTVLYACLACCFGVFWCLSVISACEDSQSVPAPAPSPPAAADWKPAPPGTPPKPFAAAPHSDPATAARADQENLGRVAAAQDAAPISRDQLMLLIPAAVAGMEPHEAEGEQLHQGAISTSLAQLEFDGPDKSWLMIQISDVGRGQVLEQHSDYLWLKESLPTGTANPLKGKVFQYKGHLAFEKCEGTPPHCRMAMVLGKRIVVEVRSIDVAPEKTRSVFQQIDLQKLQHLLAQ